MQSQCPQNSFLTNRRNFLIKSGLAAGAAALLAQRLTHAAAPTNNVPATPATPPPAQPTGAPAAAPTKVALTHGDNRTDNIFRALKAVEKEIVASIGKRRIVIKPNNVSSTNQLAASHADALAGILEFLKSIGKLENVIIAESAMGSTMEAFQNFRYTELADKYKIKLVDLDKEAFQTVFAFDAGDAKPHPVRVSSILANQTDNYIISACMLKTHDRAIATLSLKNIVVGAPLKLGGNGGMGGGMGGRGGRGFGGSDKPLIHGGNGPYGININLAMLAPLLHPTLSVIDGFEGMEGPGPLSGTKVDHRVAVVSTDYMAADTVGASLMGINPADIGYLSYLAAAKVGESDVTKMEILGEPIDKLAKKYQLSNSAQNQLKWKDPAKISASQPS